MTSLISNPLAEANPQSLDEIFSKDPVNLNDDDIEKVVAELRAQAARFEAAEKTGANKRVKKAQVTLSLDDLGA